MTDQRLTEIIKRLTPEEIEREREKFEAWAKAYPFARSDPGEWLFSAWSAQSSRIAELEREREIAKSGWDSVKAAIEDAIIWRDATAGDWDDVNAGYLDTIFSAYVALGKNEKLTRLAAASERAWAQTGVFCSDCPPSGYPTDKTRCLPCPRRAVRIDKPEGGE